MENEVIFNAPLMLPLLTFGFAFFMLLRNGFSKPRTQEV